MNRYWLLLPPRQRRSLAYLTPSPAFRRALADEKAHALGDTGRSGEAHACTGAGAGVADGTATAASVAAAAAGVATTTPTTTSAKVLLGEGEEADAEVVATTAGSGASSAIMSSRLVVVVGIMI